MEMPFSDTKSRLTRRNTDVIAAEYIATKKFPTRSNLPRFEALPFNNFGHFHLFDHKRFLCIIYHTIEAFIKIEDDPKHNKKKNQGVWLTSGISFLLLLGIVFYSEKKVEAFVFVALFTMGIAAVAFLIFDGIRLKSINREISRFKYQVLEELISDQWTLAEDFVIQEKLNRSLKLSGEGLANREEIPVLVVFDDLHPFPGFGKLQLDNSFICPPKKDKATNFKPTSFFAEAIKSSISNSGLDYIGFGEVIVLDSGSISVDSDWLDDRKIPKLTVSKEVDINEVDKSTSARKYFVIEVLFPKYSSVATFFMRIYNSGNSIGVHLALTTIGPPIQGLEYVQNRLTKYKEEQSEYDSYFKFDSGIHQAAYDNYLVSIKDQVLLQDDFHQNNTPKASDPLSRSNIDYHRRNKISEIIKLESRWPGRYYYFAYNVHEKKCNYLGR